MIGRRHDDAQSFEEAWSGRTPRDEHIADLVRFAENLCEVAAVEPDAAFRDALRSQLMDQAATTLVKSPRATRPVAAPAHQAHPARRRLAGLTAALVASAGIVTAVASSASAVPGEMLYPVKRSVESVELTLHRSDASRGSFQLAQASERLAEARQLTTKGGSESLVVKTLESFSEQAADGSDNLFSDFSDSGQEKSIRKVNDFAAAASVDLSALSTQLPTGADDSFAAATEAISDLATQATSLCSACTTADVESLVSAVTDLSKDTPATQPEPAKHSDKKDPGSSTPDTSTGSGSTGTTNNPASVVPVPTTAPTTKTPSLRDVTDPLVGGLLGNEEQEGLVPGLLKGLLGGAR
ncbi:MAG: hypothetical protein JWR27_1913 [Aeromicrobium sp.]|jgi:hypothetical protein|nr:hypothetical protein [Aeromicrobium sp.]